jgi:SAM-dependent methyltransferase
MLGRPDANRTTQPEIACTSELEDRLERKVKAIEAVAHRVEEQPSPSQRKHGVTSRGEDPEDEGKTRIGPVGAKNSAKFPKHVRRMFLELHAYAAALLAQPSSLASSEHKLHSFSSTMKGLRHLPYTIDPGKNRYHFYETLWKLRGLELLRRNLPPQGQTILDYGSGRGESVQIFGAAGYKVSGTDADPECVRLTAEHGASVLLNTADPLGQFGERSFDAVICFHVLEHVENPKSVLTALGRIARQYLVLAVPNLQTLRNALRRTPRIAEVNEGHLQSWDHGHFQNLAERHCGLELVAWAEDATILPIFNRIAPLLGNKFAIWLETTVFPKVFPFHSQSVLGLFRPAGASISLV